MNHSDLISQFQKVFDRSPECLSRGPGRVNLIGEHIDYNGGSVLPMAIEPQARIAAARRDDRKLCFASLQKEERATTQYPIERLEQPAWANYLLGVLHEFEKLNLQLPGMDVLLDSTVPLGSGLSSSAAIEVAMAKILTTLLDYPLEPLEIALLAQRAENQFVGVNCGLMDQAASACCRKGQALLLDCAAPSCKWVPFPNDQVTVVIAHSGVRRGLSQSAYNERRSQCEEALHQINHLAGKQYPDLCAVPREVFDSVSGRLSGTLARRSRHVISESLRVQDAVRMLAEVDLTGMGRVLNESHFSLRDDYEVSCSELDELTEGCREFRGVFGSRLTGAGFGGCTVTLVEPERAAALMHYLVENYYTPKSLQPLAFASSPAEGAEGFMI